MGKYRVTTESGTYLVETEDQPVPEGRAQGEDQFTRMFRGQGGQPESPQGNILQRLLGGLNRSVNPFADTPPQTSQGETVMAPSNRAFSSIPVLGQVYEAVAKPALEETAGRAAGGDVAGAIGYGAGMAGTAAIGSQIPKVAPALKRSAAKSYRSVLEPAGQLKVGVAEEIAPLMAQEKITAGSRGKLLDKLQAGKDVWGPRTDTAYAAAKPIPLTDALASLDKVRQRKIVLKGTNKIPSNRQGLDDILKSIETDVADLADPNGNIPAQLLDNFTDDLNQGLVSSSNGLIPNVPLKSRKAIEKQSARNFKIILNEQNPSAQKINAMYRMYAKAWDMVEFGRKARVASESAIKSGTTKGFGAAVQKMLPAPVRQLPNAVSNIFDSIPWNTVSGATKQRMAEALASGDNKAVWVILGAVVPGGIGKE